MTVFTWLVIVLLFLINALYVAAEFAAVSVRRSRIHQLAEEGHALAMRLLPILQDAHTLDRYIAACQIGITLSSLVLGAYGQATLAVQLTPLFASWGDMQEITARSTAAVVVLISLTVLQMVLGELVPKSLALQYPTHVALATVLPMQWSLSFFSWFIAVLNGSGIAILNLLGMPQAGHRHIHSPEEIDLLIAESRDGGLLEPDEHLRLRQALRLGRRPIRQLMIPRQRIVSIDINAPVDEIVRQVTVTPYTRFPVYRENPDNVIGMLHTKDFVTHYLEHGTFASLDTVLRPLLHVPDSVTADRLLTLLKEYRSHQALVVDEFGGIVGLITLEDVLAEVFGEVSDEFKAGQPQPERLADGRVRLPGLMHLDKAEPWIGVLWQGQAGTISGHIIDTLGYFPRPGEQVTIDGVHLEIEQVAHHTISSILAIPISAEQEQATEA